jgi:hypothetical protein
LQIICKFLYTYYMDEAESVESQNMNQYYVLGAVVLVAVVIAGYLLRSKPSSSTASPIADVVPTATPTPGPITGLACDLQYYNPVVGLPKYYLSVEGGDVSKATKVDCTFTSSVDGKVVNTTRASSSLTAKPERGGNTFRCTTEGVELKADVPTVVDVTLKDDLKSTATCSATFLFPAP